MLFQEDGSESQGSESKIRGAVESLSDRDYEDDDISTMAQGSR